METIISAYYFNISALHIIDIIDEFMNSDIFSDPSSYGFKLLHKTMDYVNIVKKVFIDLQKIEDIFYTRDTNVIRMILRMSQSLHKIRISEDTFANTMEYYRINSNEGEYLKVCKILKKDYDIGQIIVSINLEKEIVIEGNDIRVMIN
jgi:hypothetical protein